MPNSGNPNPPKRGKIVGWSAAAARRNTNFLRSVDVTELTGYGYAITLTIRECPASSDAWSALVRAWIERQSRAGLIRLHWVMEWQRRGVPHLHVAAWYEEEQGFGLPLWTDRESWLVGTLKPCADWIGICGEEQASPKAQFARKITGAAGWFEYMAKHCSRSRMHYQRQRESIPAGWKSSGRVWGKRGTWAVVEPVKGEMDNRTFFSFRRLMQRRRLAEARAYLPLNSRQVSAIRRSRKCNHRGTSETRPVSEWMPLERQVELLNAAASIRYAP